MERAPTSFVEAFYYQVWNTDEEAAAREILTEDFRSGGSLSPCGIRRLSICYI